MDWPLKYPHPWRLSPEEAEALQRRLASAVTPAPLDWDALTTVGGVDVGIRDERLRAAVVVLRFPTLQLLDQAVAEVPLTMPYVPGLLSFREIPAILEALKELRLRPDVLMVDGHGIAHPRRLGIAAHLGVVLDWPTIGVAKSILVGHPQGALGEEAGSTVPLVDDGQVVGMGVRTRARVKPVWVSIGHRVTLDDAVQLVLRSARGYRLPEPTRLAHHLASGKHGNDLGPLFQAGSAVLQ